MPPLPVNHHLPLLRAHRLVRLPYPPLQIQHHRARRIDHLHPVLPRRPVRLRRLPVRPEQHPAIPQPRELPVLDGAQPLLLQPPHLQIIVHDVPDAVKLPPLQLLLRLPDGIHHPEAKPRMLVYFHRHTRPPSFSPLLPIRSRMIPTIISTSSSTVISLLSTTTASSVCRSGPTSRWLSI